MRGEKLEKWGRLKNSSSEWGEKLKISVPDAKLSGGRSNQHQLGRE